MSTAEAGLGRARAGVGCRGARALRVGDGVGGTPKAPEAGRNLRGSIYLAVPPEPAPGEAGVELRGWGYREEEEKEEQEKEEAAGVTRVAGRERGLGGRKKRGG